MMRDIYLPKILKRGPTKSNTETLACIPPRIIAVTSGKGGVGKTNLVVNLGLTLTAMKKQVIILDADLGMANVEILMNVTPPYSLYDCIYRNRSINEVICPAPGGVRIISGGSGILGLANLNDINQRRLVESLDILNKMADFVLVDTGAGISKNVLAFLASVEEVIVVVVPEPTSIADAYGLIKVLAKYDLHREVNLVVNRARSRAEANQTAEKMDGIASRFLGLRVNYLGFIPEDRIVNDAVRSQEPFALYAGQSVPALSVAGIARALTDDSGTVNTPGRGMVGFVEKLVRLFK